MDPTYILLITPFVLWPFIAKAIWGKTISWTEIPIHIGIGMMVVAIVFFSGRYSAAEDTEIWNGQLTGKTRVHDTYIESYDCFCSDSCSGSGKNRSCHQVCQTCYRDHYTVDWDLQSTIGGYGVKHLDRTSKSVYKTKDPALYTQAEKGQACAKTKRYTNWVKAVPESLFNTKTISDPYANQVPAYPKTYGLYKYDHVINMSGVDIGTLNTDINNINKVLGNTKQVNILMIVTNITDPSYRYSVENAWVGAKKNDVVLFVGIDKSQNIIWADAMTFAQNKGNELFHVTMRDGLTGMKTLTNTKLIPFISKTVSEKFDRISMKDFEGLKDEIVPSPFVIWLSLILGGLISFLLTVFFHYNTIDRNGINRDRSAQQMFPAFWNMIDKIKQLFNKIKNKVRGK